MSGKRAKALRKMQRAADVEPALDAKRRQSIEEAERREAKRIAVETLKREQPEEWERQQREYRRDLELVRRRFGIVAGAIAALLPQ